MPPETRRHLAIRRATNQNHVPPWRWFAVGVVGSLTVLVWPSPPTSDESLPYSLQLRLNATTTGRVSLWWDRLAGYVTSPDSTATWTAADQPLTVSIPCPSGELVRLLLQLSPQPTNLHALTIVDRHGSSLAVLPLADLVPLHDTGVVSWREGVMAVTPRTPGVDAQLELTLRPALNLPVPTAGAPATTRAVIRRERWIAIGIAVLGVMLGVFVASRDHAGAGRWSASQQTCIAVAYAALALLFARRPDVFGLPQFWAEDGAVFFAEQQALGITALAHPYAGYLHLYPRLVALAASPFPFPWMPTVYLIGATAAVLAPVVRATSGRVGLPSPGLCGLAVVLLPHMGELVVSATNAQWFGALALPLIATARAPQSRGQAAGDAITVLLCGFSGPFALLLFPLFAARLRRDRSSHAWMLFALVGLAAIVQGTCFVQASISAAGDAALRPDYAALVDATGRRLGGEFFGLANGSLEKVPDHSGIL